MNSLHIHNNKSFRESHIKHHTFLDFSDVLLQNNIRKIYCIDVGKNQLHPKIRQSKKIVVYEQTDFRVYRYINLKDIQILLTPTNRLNSITEKYSKSMPLSKY